MPNVFDEFTVRIKGVNVCIGDIVVKYMFPVKLYIVFAFGII